MNEEPDEVERWHVGDRYYGITLASTPSSMNLELDDLGPGPGRGLVAMASCDDDSGKLMMRFFTESSLPMALLEQFVDEAQRRLPRSE
jgi:hypothetical protein